MKINQKVLFMSVLTYLAWGVFWQLVELARYGFVTPRIVDDIVSIPVFIFIYMMWHYREKCK